MSLSRPVRFSLLKLPFLCIESVIKNSDVFDIIYFALISKRTRQIVKHLKIPLNNIKIFLSWFNYTTLGSLDNRWNFMNARQTYSSFNKEHQYSSEYPLVLQKDAIPLYTRQTDYGLESYTNGNELIAVKIAMEFLNEVFKCSVETVKISGDYIPKSGDIGVRSSVNLSINSTVSRPFGYDYIQKLTLLMEKLKVTGTCTFEEFPGLDFHCDPKLFKCEKLVFWSLSYTLNRGILMQLEVPRLYFSRWCPSVEDIVSFVTQWFHSDNMKLESLYIEFRNWQISLEKLQMKELDPLPFSERTRVPPSEPFRDVDFSKGLEIIRHDGLVATIHVNDVKENFMFYVWHDQPAITQN